MKLNSEDYRAMLLLLAAGIVMAIGAIADIWYIAVMGIVLFFYAVIRIPWPPFCPECGSEDVELVLDKETTEFQKHFRCVKCSKGWIQMDSPWERWKKKRKGIIDN